jgi:hypothetical protein
MSGSVGGARGLSTSVHELATTQPSRRASSKIECRTPVALSVVFVERPLRAMWRMNPSISRRPMRSSRWLLKNGDVHAHVRPVRLKRRASAAFRFQALDQEQASLRHGHAASAVALRTDCAHQSAQLRLGVGAAQALAGRRVALGPDTALDLLFPARHLPYQISLPDRSRWTRSEPVPRRRRGDASLDAERARGMSGMLPRKRRKVWYPGDQTHQNQSDLT